MAPVRISGLSCGFQSHHMASWFSRGLHGHASSNGRRGYAHFLVGIVLLGGGWVVRIARTSSTVLFPRQQLQTLCVLSRALPGSRAHALALWYPNSRHRLTGWNSSSSKLIGCPGGNDRSIGLPQIQHGSPLDLAIAMSLLRLEPFDLRGLLVPIGYAPHPLLSIPATLRSAPAGGTPLR